MGRDERSESQSAEQRLTLREEFHTKNLWRAATAEFFGVLLFTYIRSVWRWAALAQLQQRGRIAAKDEERRLGG